MEALLEKCREQVATNVVAWIEIGKPRKTRSPSGVATNVVAWIEIYSPGCTSWRVPVATNVVAWIEIDDY